MKVKYEGKYIGKIKDPYIPFCKPVFHELIIYNEYDEVLYNLKAPLKANYCLAIPSHINSKLNDITYKIYDNKNLECGEIRHLFYGF